MTQDYITTNLEITLESGERFTTGFNILLSLLKNKSIQEFVDDYYVGTDYYIHHSISRKIKNVEILELKK